VVCGGWEKILCGYLPASRPMIAPSTQPATLPSARSWSEIYATVAPSIYQVQSYRRTPNGDVFESAGTAWSVAPGLLATNAHVAEMLDDVKDDGYVIARLGGKENDLRIVSAKLHPGYREFERLHQLYRPFLPAEGQFMNLKSPCDVALLSVHPDDIARQAPPLPLADDAMLAMVSAGLPIAFCGYPAEGVATNYENPAPYQNDGTVTRLLDLFDSTATIDSLVYIGHSLNTAGGASGSPIFDREGRVVAINFAGSYLFGVRIPLAGHKYAVPLRFLRELLDNTADARQAERTTLWTENIVRRYQNGLSGVRQMMIRRANEFIDNDPEKRYAGGSLVSFDELPAGQSSFVVAIPEPGKYLVLSACEDIRSNPKVVLQTGNPIVLNQITREGRPYFGAHGEATLTVTGGAATVPITIDGNTRTWIMLVRLKESD
ncbi:MAG TPA: serine protease, partial [Tepidisphaeraceae bacterium]|nr:serine protease [Tepidisphaeraceae bacterium]